MPASHDERRYTYRGDRFTDPALVGRECVAVLLPDGKCIVSKRSTMLVLFAGETTARVVLTRQLRKISSASSASALDTARE